MRLLPKSTRVGSFLCCVFLLLAKPLYSAQEKPNFIIIFTDDQGYSDLGVFGAEGFKTPHIDELSKDSVIARSFYTTPVCTPSRASLQTGKYHANINLTGLNGRAVYFPESNGGLGREEVTIANVLKPMGYETALIGKWHLGHLDEYLPTAKGYDYYYGIPYSNDMWVFKNPKYSKDLKITNGMTMDEVRKLEGNRQAGKAKDIVPLMRGNEVIEIPAVQETLTERYFDEAIRFIDKAHAEKKPFYVCITPAMPHVPLYVSEKFAGKTKRGTYGDTIEEIDYNVGRLVANLREQGLLDNTVIVFTSDNGPWTVKGENGGSAKPLRNGKGSLFEGGVRVPCVIYVPAKLGGKPQDTDEIMATIDILPTFAHMAGAAIPKGVDGVDLTPFLTGKSDVSPRQSYLFYAHVTNKLTGMRDGDWKVIFDFPLYGAAARQETGKFRKEELPLLFNLREDISEKNNLAPANAQKTEALIQKAKQIAGL